MIDDCLTRGMDVTQGGARYNFAGVQAIQIANVADSLAAIKLLVYDEKKLSAQELLHALQTNFEDAPLVRTMLLNKVPKYGNDVPWVDELGAKWVNYFADGLRKYRNGRGGIYQMGLYTVSAHVPMGQNVAASADGDTPETRWQTAVCPPCTEGTSAVRRHCCTPCPACHLKRRATARC